jgi:tetratricopeptide (TPR) repeat protein
MGAMIQASHHVNIALRILNQNKMEDGRLYGDVADVFLAAQQYEECEKALTYAENLSKYSSTVFDQMQINTVRGGLELRRFNYGKAEMYLDKALSTSAETEYIDITIRSLLLLAELSTRKFELTNSVDELQIAEQRINDLYIVLKQFNLPQIICELLIIHASLAKAQMNFERADDLLSQAITLAKAENYYILNEHAQVMREKLTQPLTQSMKVQPDPATLYEITKEIEVLGDIYRSITTPQQFSAELSEPLALLIVLPEGIAAFSYVFSDELKGDIHDDLLLGGFLRALSDLSGEIFSKGGQITSLRSIQYMHYSIMVERRDDVIYSVITNKETYGMRHLLRTLADQISIRPHLVKYSIKVDKEVQSELYKQVEAVYWAYMND